MAAAGEKARPPRGNDSVRRAREARYAICRESEGLQRRRAPSRPHPRARRDDPRRRRASHRRPRLAALATISIATLAGKIDAGGRGALLSGLDNDDPNHIIAGSTAAAALAITGNAGLRGLEKFTALRAPG